MIADPIRELVVMWQSLIADGLEPDLALDVAITVQHNIARDRFAQSVLDDLESLPVLEVS